MADKFFTGHCDDAWMAAQEQRLSACWYAEARETGSPEMQQRAAFRAMSARSNLFREIDRRAAALEKRKAH